MDVVVLVLMLGVLVGGFWMVGTSSGEKMEVLETRMSHVDNGLKGLAQQLVDIQQSVNDLKMAAGAKPAAPPAPTPAPAPSPGKPAK
jgi:hypothetical protein